MLISEALSMRVRELLIQRNMSQYRLEILSGISHNTMSFFLNGRYNSANMKTVFVIINALNLPVAEFFDSELFNCKNLKLN